MGESACECVGGSECESEGEGGGESACACACECERVCQGGMGRCCGVCGEMKCDEKKDGERKG